MRNWASTGTAAIAIAAATTSIFSATGAAAQEAPAEATLDEGEDIPAAATAGSVGGNQIVITAQRREQSLQDVPVAVTAIDSEQRDKLGIDSIEDITNVTPGLSYTTSLDRASIRGVGRLTNTIGSDPGVAVYNDGFYTSSTVEAAKTPLFVERVEILRGPQGTLYGRNSVGGAINIISRRPTDDWQAEARAQVEDSSGILVEGFVSGPLTGGVRGRLAYQYGPDPVFGGLYENIGAAGDEGYLDRKFIDAQLEIDISPDIELWVKYTSAEWDDRLRGGNYLGDYNTTEVTDGLIPNLAYGYTTSNPGKTDLYKINTDTARRWTLQDNHTFVANLTADMGDVVMKYVGGYQTYLFELYDDNDALSREFLTTSVGAAAPYTITGGTENLYVEDKDYFSNEITFSSDYDNPLQWIGGLYWYHEDFYQPISARPVDRGDTFSAMVREPRTFRFSRAPTPATPFGNFTAADPNPSGNYYFQSGDLTVDSYAAFGQLDYEVSDKLSLTAGLRYSLDEKRGTEVYRLIIYQPATLAPAGFCPLSPATPASPGCGRFAQAFDYTGIAIGDPSLTGAATRTVKGSWDGFSWRLAGKYELDEQNMVYLSYARGLKSGGFRLDSFTPDYEVDKETVDSIEVGGKLSPVDALTLNVAAFYYIFQDAQVPLGVVNPATGLNSSRFLNLDETNNYGLELEAVWNVTDMLELRAGYGYINATIEDTGGRLFDDPDIAGPDSNDIVGNRLPGTSEHKLSASALYDIPLDFGNIYLAASYYYRSDQYSGLFENELARAPGFGRTDLRVSFVELNRRFSLIGYVQNVFDEVGYNYINYDASGGPFARSQFANLTQPRIFGLEAQVRF